MIQWEVGEIEALARSARDNEVLKIKTIYNRAPEGQGSSLEIGNESAQILKALGNQVQDRTPSLKMIAYYDYDTTLDLSRFYITRALIDIACFVSNLRSY